MAHELTYDNVVEVLLARVPELQPTYQKLLNERGEPLTDEERNEWLVEGVEELLDEEGRLPFPKYFFAAEAAWFAEKLAARAPNDPAAADTLRRLAAVLEEMATSKDPYLPEMMAAGFVEVLNPDAPGFHYFGRADGAAFACSGRVVVRAGISEEEDSQHDISYRECCPGYTVILVTLHGPTTFAKRRARGCGNACEFRC